MKIKLLFTFLTIFSRFAFSQTVDADNYRLEYVTYAGGHIVLSLQNKKDCDLTASFRWGTKDTVLLFTAHEMRQVMLPASGTVTVMVRAESGCQCFCWQGWHSLILAALPVREEPMKHKQEKAIQQGRVRVVAMDGSFAKEFSEEDFKQVSGNYRHRYFIIRDGKTKEVIL